MGDVFLRALSADLEQTQRALPPYCLFCVPQPRSLLADEAITQDVLYTHFLMPTDAAAAPERRLGDYDTLNGKQVAVLGSHIHTGKGFGDRRQVRILLSEKREIHHQEVTVLHISRPLEGGIEVPEDPSEIDVATFRRYTAILRSFPENELVFYQLDETISQVHKICAQEQVYERYKQTLPANLKEEWEAAVEELIHAGSFDDVEEDYRLQRRHGGGVSHLLQIQQVVECYLMESLHELIFPRVVASCQEQDKKLQQVMYRMRHYTPEDFGLRKEFQCFAAEARDTLLTVTQKKTPLDMLLVFKTCIDRVSDAITLNVKLRRLDFETYQLTTDDILDQLLFVLVQAFNQVLREKAEGVAGSASPFPIAAVIRYISDYHFINSNTTALGFTIANFQVAVEYFMMRADHDDDCKDCADLALQRGNAGFGCSQVIEESMCVRAAHKIRRDLMKAVENVELARRDTGAETGQDSPHAIAIESSDSAANGVTSMKRLSIIGEWSAPDKVEDISTGDSSADSLTVHPVEFVGAEQLTSVSDTNIINVSGGQRFFAAVAEDGKLFTWGDSSGGRLGYVIADGDSRRVSCPQRVFALEQHMIIQVSCGAFHTLVTDLNGHVFAWGSNTRGQLGFLSPGTPSTAVETPSVVGDLRGMYMSSVACGEYHSLALSSDGRVFSWGCSKYGKLGRAAEGLLDVVQPREVDADWTGWAMDMKSRIGSGERYAVRCIAAGKDHSLAISSDGAGFTWGRGDSGQLGHGCYMDVSEPKQVMAISAAITDKCGLIDIAGGNDFSVFLLENGTTYICGRDPSLDADKPHLSPTLLTLPSTLEREFFGQITAVSSGEAQRFTVNPFGQLTLADEDHAKLVNISDALVQAKFEEYEEYLNSEKRVDISRWKKFKTSGAAMTYLERKKSNPDSNLPEMCMVGPLPGTLDEIMFGLVSPTLEAMRIKSSYLNDFSAAAVLASVVEPTEEEPFRSVVVKWMEIDIPGASVGIVRNRDYIYVESSGILHLKNGESVGYHLFHSVNFPETHELPGRVRGNMSLCAIFHQEGPDQTDCFGTGVMDPRGDIIRSMAVSGMVQAIMAGLKYSYCGQMKKLAWLLEHKHAEQRERSARVVKPVCVTCSKPTKNSKLRVGKSDSTCKLCFAALCGSCKVSKKLSFISPDLELAQRKVAFCVKCLMEATRLDTLEAARQQFVYKQTIHRSAYSSIACNERLNSVSSTSLS
ncbi:hypothetical protein PHYPSEUDO_013347 [Phytophthora pseudosyringae]|uniref:VPS9 domain-containing protein n=1 Tax=Phytophthora pseudosyringae TaxID=221518 RepID=A0A8T1W897_9STRA|nr:hypothetical protein PHYPSEUDO_013347 [Phytophthora pseudosyringae]